ncbi:hypothetical protein ABEB36_007945 [Hypothenemus hampei]|uniref:Uncharacterized protein n=1 Tax=Hypothenemus hampei TaxID=57062 RepID=A0ABD1EVN6_HYPHA
MQEPENGSGLEQAPETNAVNDTFDFLGKCPWSAYLLNCIGKDQKEDITARYALFDNCPLLQAPKIGQELKSRLNDKIITQDKLIHKNLERGCDQLLVTPRTSRYFP